MNRFLSQTTLVFFLLVLQLYSDQCLQRWPECSSCGRAFGAVPGVEVMDCCCVADLLTSSRAKQHRKWELFSCKHSPGLEFPFLHCFTALTDNTASNRLIEGGGLIDPCWFVSCAVLVSQKQAFWKSFGFWSIIWHQVGFYQACSGCVLRGAWQRLCTSRGFFSQSSASFFHN